MTSSNDDGIGDEGYIVEYVVVGNSVKVTAFDPVTLREVSIVGARNATKEQLAKLAIKKLAYMNEKNIKNPDES